MSFTIRLESNPSLVMVTISALVSVFCVCARSIGAETTIIAKNARLIPRLIRVPFCDFRFIASSIGRYRANDHTSLNRGDQDQSVYWPPGQPYQRVLILVLAWVFGRSLKRIWVLRSCSSGCSLFFLLASAYCPLLWVSREW